MTGPSWLALALFAAVACITPGQTNMPMSCSGLRRGARATVPIFLS